MIAIVVGASAGLGRALAGELAATGHDLVVVSSDARDLAALASDLRIRHGVRVVGVPLDLGAEPSGAEGWARPSPRWGAPTRFSCRLAGPPKATVPRPTRALPSAS